MKRNKAVNVTKGDIKTNFRTNVTDHSYCYNKNPRNARTYIRHATIKQNQTGFKGFDFQYVSNRSHLTCSCENSGKKCQETSYFTTKINEIQSKSFTDVGVGSVKALQRRKVKRIYLPETEERAVGTLDFPLCDNPKCRRHFSHFNEFYHRISRKCEEGSIDSNKILFLDKKLSPLVQTKSNCTNPLSTHFLINKINKSEDNTPTNKLINVPVQVGQKTLSKSPKIKIFKELSMNTESIDTEKIEKSEVEISVERSKLLNNKNGVEFSSSLDSLVQHVYNLDRPCNGAASQVSVDPMENKLEREYRKIFSNEPRDCPCNNKISTTNSDSLLRRFEALQRDVPCENDLKKNASKTSSGFLELSYRDVSIESDPPSLRSPSNSNVKIITPIPSDAYKKNQTKMDKKNNNSAPKIRKSSHWCPSDGEDHQGIKGMFKMWGKKLSLDEGCYKRSKFKCFDIKKRSEVSVKSNKVLKNKSKDKKEEKKFRFFKKKVKAPSRVSKSKKDVMTGRCEVREGLTIKIGKSFLKQDQNAVSVKKINSKYDDMLLKAWLQKFVSRSTKNLTMSWDSSIFADCSNATEMRTNSSYDTDMLLFSQNAIKNDSLRIQNKNSLINFSRQYIQAWMIPKTILDRLVKTKIYWNAKSGKYNKKKDIDFGSVKDTKCSINKEVLSTNNRSVLDSSTGLKDGLSSECVMVNISLGCISEINHQTYIHRQSNEEVYNVINYETPLTSSVNFSGIENGNQVPDLTNNTEITQREHNVKSNKEHGIHNDDHCVKSEVFQGKKLSHNIQTPETNAKDVKYPMYEGENAKICKSLEGSLYLLPKNCKHAEIYLKKYFHNWIPLGLDLHLWCISDTRFHSACNLNNKDENFKSFSNVTDQIRYTTLASSRDASVDNEDRNEHEKSELKDKYNYIKTMIRKNKSDAPLSELGIRIWPKDSLEVFKKRKLYSSSNKAKWNYDKDPAVSVSKSTKSKSPLPKFTSNKHPPKKRVTITEIEDKNSKHKLPLKMASKNENEIKKNKNVSYLTTAQQASEPINNNSIEPKAKIKKKEEKLTLQPLSTESDEPNSAEDSDNCTATSDTEENSKYLSSTKNYESKTSECPNLERNNLTKSNNSDNQNEKNKDKANEVSSKLGFNFSDYLKPSTIKNKCNTLRQKFISEKKGSSDESLKSDNRSKRCSITTDVQKISSLSQTDDKFEETSKSGITKLIVDDKIESETSKGKSKMLGFHIKKPPVKKNMSRACSAVGDKNEKNVINNSADIVENTSLIKENKDISRAIKEEIYGEENNKKIERNSTSINLDSKDSRLCTISVSGSMKKLYFDKELNSDQPTEVNKDSDFIEISFKIKRKQVDDRGMYINVNDSSDKTKKKNKKKLKGNKSSIPNKNKAIYLVQNESESSMVYENCKSCVNIKIIIKNFNHNYFHKKTSQRDKFSIYSKRISEKFQTVSSGFKKAVNVNLNSIENFKIDSTDLVDNLRCNNKPIEGMELLNLKYMAIESDKNKCSEEQTWFKNKNNSDEITNSCGPNESKQTLSITPDVNETENENVSFNSKTSSRNYSFDNRKISNCKELKRKIIKKIVHCVRDLNKSKRKEKINEVKRALRTVLLSDYIDKNVYVNNYEQLNPNSSILAKVTNTTNDYFHFDSAKCLKSQSTVSTKNYYYTVVTEGNKHGKVVSRIISLDCGRNKGQCFKTLGTKSGVTDLRTCECVLSTTEDVDSHPLNKKKGRVPITNYNNLKNYYLHYIPSNISKMFGKRNITTNDSFLKSYNAGATIIQSQVHQNLNDIKKNEEIFNSNNEVNNTTHSAVLMHDEIDVTTVCSTFYKDKCIVHHQHCKINENSDNYTNELTDIFQLPEIKNAVFELYNATENLSDNSDLFKTLPKFVNEVENVLLV